MSAPDRRALVARGRSRADARASVLRAWAELTCVGDPGPLSRMQTAAPAPRRNPTPLPEPAADALIATEFAHLRGLYLDVAARRPLAASALRAAEAVLRAQAERAVPKAEWLALVETVRAQAAALIGAAPEEVAFTRNVSDGLNIVGAGLRLGRGERIVIAPAASFRENG